MKSLLSPKEVALAIGVSESSVKRWADEGMIEVSRTAGGHRRISVTEAIRFIRAAGHRIAHPEVLGIADLTGDLQAVPEAGEEADLLYRYLREGAALPARGLLTSLYLAGWSPARLADGPIHEAMARLGELWHEDEAGIYFEHRATDICVHAVNQLRALVSVPIGGPRAVGGGPQGDPYTLPSLLAALVLQQEGFRVVHLGAETPVRVLDRACLMSSPRLAYLSVTAGNHAEEIGRDLERLLRRLKDNGTMLVLGGRRRDRLRLTPSPALHVAATLAELEALAKGLAGSFREPAAGAVPAGDRTPSSPE